jgi:hypothetical protein
MNDTGSGNRLGLGIVLATLVLMHLQPALALGIGVGRSPAPPKAIVNDGFGVESYNWSIEFESTPDHYTEFILDPHNNLKKCVFHDLFGWTPVPPPPWDTCTYVNESASWPQSTPILGASSWTAPAGAMLGRYEIRIQYFSLEGGEPWRRKGP